MPLSVARVRQCLQAFDFKALFTQELGWDRHSGSLPVAVDGTTYVLQAVAEKRGMQVFECPAPPAGMPDYALRRQIERQAAKSAHEHIIVYTDPAKTVQTWQWVRREPGRPLACREHTLHRGQSGDGLIQKLQLLVVELAEEESLSLVDVTQRARQAFDMDKVTKRFYDRFKTEHTAFLSFIEGITSQGDRDWYASLMLNRLMFVYFIQKKGFLGGRKDGSTGDPHYLRNRLKAVQQRKGKDKFLSFYRYFLLRLFHEGFAQPLSQRKKDLDALLGQVPYLNGGLFDLHDLEHNNPDIHIPDEAFERLFNFFDAYQWHLDERPLRADNEINPDVLGYIFEKYINQKQMGAYYTKEDITGYIARNTIIPFLLDAAQKECVIAFLPDGALWRLLRDDPDRFLYPSARKGVELPLPPEVAAGLNDVSRRDGWNRPAPTEYALPTETWREHVARRKRCLDLRAKLQAGQVHAINDLVTFNLDICQLAEDAIENCEGPELLRALYHAIENLSVLDPTCGSGAFLFAALNILEPLYEACLDRMQGFLDDLERSATKHHAETFADFRKVLDDVAQHPNRRYFILKSIIISNLYGVDIMEEAVEICKLRLFLKLVAQVEKVNHLEPLPDIDFNIRAGNTLIGFATLDEARATLKGRLGFGQEKEVERIVADAARADEEFRRFRSCQTQFGKDNSGFSEMKDGLRKRLDGLREQLDHYLAGEHGVDPEDAPAYQGWHDSHRPFHWFAEFYGIMRAGGFDAIIGNPPYVEYSKVQEEYRVRNYATESCGNLYAFVVERNASLLNSGGRSGMIVPHSAFCTDRMAPLLGLFTGRRATWVSTYDIRPSKLFVGVDQRLAIYLTATSSRQGTYGTRYHRWHESARPDLFQQLRYADVGGLEYANAIAKAEAEIELQVWKKLQAHDPIGSDLGGAGTVYYHNAPRYWIRALTFAPYFRNERDGEKVSTQVKSLPVRDRHQSAVAAAALNSTLFYWWFILFSDSRHLNAREIERFRLGLRGMHEAARRELEALCSRLMDDYRRHAVRKECRYKSTGLVVYDEFYPRHSKAIIDEIDNVLARHYGFTAEELDFIINYDIKYRLGQDAEGDAEE
jgi:hypothetical protein